MMVFVFFNDTATTEIYTLFLHDALPISLPVDVNASAALCTVEEQPLAETAGRMFGRRRAGQRAYPAIRIGLRSEEHTSELQSRQYLVCRLLLEKKKSS